MLKTDHLQPAKGLDFKAAWVPLAAAPVLLLLAIAFKAAGTFEMSNGELVIIALRLFVPLMILRFWLAGGIVAMLLDGADVILIELIGLGGFGSHYAELDKLLDSYYLGIEVLVAWRFWANPWARWTSVGLFAYRLVGVVLFETLNARIILFIFPNLFENWWLYCAVVMKWFPNLAPTGWKTTVVPLLLLLIPKMGQEYLLHFAEAKPWNWTKEHLL
jgi:hypothetical protein